MQYDTCFRRHKQTQNAIGTGKQTIRFAYLMIF